MESIKQILRKKFHPEQNVRKKILSHFSSCLEKVKDQSLSTTPTLFPFDDELDLLGSAQMCEFFGFIVN